MVTKIWARDTILVKGDEIWPRETILIKMTKIWPRDTILIKDDENMAKRYYPN